MSSKRVKIVWVFPLLGVGIVALFLLRSSTVESLVSLLAASDGTAILASKETDKSGDSTRLMRLSTKGEPIWSTRLEGFIASLTATGFNLVQAGSYLVANTTNVDDDSVDPSIPYISQMTTKVAVIGFEQGDVFAQTELAPTLPQAMFATSPPIVIHQNQSVLFILSESNLKSRQTHIYRFSLPALTLEWQKTLNDYSSVLDYRLTSEALWLPQFEINKWVKIDLANGHTHATHLFSLSALCVDNVVVGLGYEQTQVANDETSDPPKVLLYSDGRSLSSQPFGVAGGLLHYCMKRLDDWLIIHRDRLAQSKDGGGLLRIDSSGQLMWQLQWPDWSARFFLPAFEVSSRYKRFLDTHTPVTRFIPVLLDRETPEGTQSRFLWVDVDNGQTTVKSGQLNAKLRAYELIRGATGIYYLLNDTLGHLISLDGHTGKIIAAIKVAPDWLERFSVTQIQNDAIWLFTWRSDVDIAKRVVKLDARTLTSQFDSSLAIVDIRQQLMNKLGLVEVKNP